MLSLLLMLLALPIWDAEGIGSYLGKKQERTSTCWDYPEKRRRGRAALT